MLKRTFAFILVGSLLTFVVPPSESEAAGRKGKWVDYYGGNAFPVGAVCLNSFLINRCMVGDTKAYNFSSGPEQ